ncbi:hypothetical protein JVU11DRAFT_11699 [Chiua virens]|nr:hypothetical protein JVU11DRAFT_11699 [Chiua virens]
MSPSFLTMSATDTTTGIYTCAPVPYHSNGPASAPPGHHGGTGAFIIKKEKLWGIGHNRNANLPNGVDLHPNGGTSILLYEFVPSEYPEFQKESEQIVEKTIKQWEEYANVKFLAKDESNPDILSDIRVRFGLGPSSWGYIGPSRPTDKVTVSLGGLPGLPPEKSKAIILHEFGHVLGMLHEHQSPVRGGDIVLNEEAVFKHFDGCRTYLRNQIIKVFNHSDSNFSEFDPKSIMMYPLPAKLIREGKPVGANLELSPLDKAYIQLAYPHNSSRQLLNAMGTIGIPESDALNIIKPLMEPTDTVDTRLEKVRDAFFNYNKNSIEAKALLKLKEAQTARKIRHR